MSSINPQYERFLVEHVLTPFIEKRLTGIQQLSIDSILKSKNPYLFRAKNLEIAGELVKSVMDAYLSSQEETVFGNLLEDFAIYVSILRDGGFKRKPPLRSIDLEFRRNDAYYIVGIKSGTAWGNSDQISAMKTHFASARKWLREHEHVTLPIVAVNGCMYGTESRPLKDILRVRGQANRPEEPDRVYYKYAGQDFWDFLSGDDQLYQTIIVPFGKQAKEKDTQFREHYDRKLNQMTQEFMTRFLTSENAIDWGKLIDFVSKRTGIGQPEA
jgi:site-specific DNA-methyltransferase (cytosine-N4-specific)